MNVLLTVVLILSAHAIVSQSNPDEIIKLPGYSEDIKFRQYAGYLQSNATNNRNLFYWFVESQRAPATDPVLLWLNGGPGCSSLSGFLSENGPFMTNPDGKTLYTNNFSWNKVANVLFLEAPAGVGFSYSDQTTDYTSWNDDKTANDTYQFLLNFFDKYPQFSTHPFFISGESYAGHYIPTLAYTIHQGNQKSTKKINLKGLLIGNGVTDDVEDANSIPPFLKDHSIMPINQYNAGYEACKGDFYAHQQEPECKAFLNALYDNLNGINPYYLYDTCPVTAINSEKFGATKVDPFVHPLFTMYRRRVSALPSPSNAARDSPCVPDSALESYMNMEEVKKALHATAKQSLKWAVCSMTVNRYYDWQYKSMIPFYHKLLAANYKILVYSGDVDAVVNGMGTQAAVEKMGYKIVSDWQAWNVDTDQGRVVGGFIRKYESGLTFITVRGAGHMVPTVKPASSLHFLTKFLNDIIYGGIEIGKAYLRTVDKPVPKAGQVVIENLAIAQNPVDVAQFIEFKLSSKF